MARNPSGERPSNARLHEAPVPYSRRSICRGAAVVALPLTAGCSSLSGLFGGNPGEVTVFNRTDSALTVTITVTRLPDETTVLSETTDIESSQAAKFNDVFDSPAQYRFEVETADGPSNSHEWNLPSTDHYLSVVVHPDSIEFRENEP